MRSLGSYQSTKRESGRRKEQEQVVRSRFQSYFTANYHFLCVAKESKQKLRKINSKPKGQLKARVSKAEVRRERQQFKRLVE